TGRHGFILMAVAYDTSATGTNSGSTITMTAMSTGGTNRLLILMFHGSNTISAISGGSITWTKLMAVTAGEVWVAFANAQLSSVTFTITQSGSSSSAAVISAYSGPNRRTGGIAFIGAFTTTRGPTGTWGSNSVTTTKPNSLVISCCGCDTTVTLDANQTMNAEATTGGTTRAAQARQNSTTASAGTSVTATYTYGGTPFSWAVVSIEI